MKEFVFGSLSYKYQLVQKPRKTLSLTVKPNLDIIVKSPLNLSEQQIEDFLKRKWFWLEKQLSFFRKYNKKNYEKEYISGESYWYLGKQYKLELKRDNESRLVLTKNKMIIYTSSEFDRTTYNKGFLEIWYKYRTKEIFKERYSEVMNKFGYEIWPALEIKKMKRKWGSFSSGKFKISLNPKLIHASIDCIDYVIVHELCHLVHKKHDKAFYKLLADKCPGWRKLKERLEAFPI